MAKDVQITVSLDPEADPPVSVCPLDLRLKGKKTFKVHWEKAKYTEDFKFESLKIADTLFTNPTSDGTPGQGSPLSRIKVENSKARLRDDVEAAVQFEYTLTVRSGGASYSTAAISPETDTRRPTIRNEP